MKNVLKILAFIAGGLLALSALAIVAVYAISTYLSSKSYAVPDARLAVPIPSTAAAVERGRYLVRVVGACEDCHGPDLGGKRVDIEAAIATVHGSNLTAGQGGIQPNYTDADFVRAIRYGVKPNGDGILVMPSEDYNRFNDADLGAIIAYLKTVPPVDRAKGRTEVPLPGRILLVAGLIPTPGIDRIDVQAAPPEPVLAGPTEEHGAYLANISCVGCHGKSFSGGAVPGSGPGDPKARNLTPGGNLGRWSEQQFIATLRSGKTPEGADLNPLRMPWPVFSKMTDDDLRALYAYFKAQPTRADEQP